MVIGAGSPPNLRIPKKNSELNGGVHSELCMRYALSLELNHSTMAGQLTFSCLEAAVFSSLGAKRTFCRGSPRTAHTARHFGKYILDPATTIGFLSRLKRQEPASVPTRSLHACRYGSHSISPAKRPGNRCSHNSFPPFCPDPAWCGLCSQCAPPA